MNHTIPRQIRDFDENTLDIGEQVKINCLSPGCQTRLAEALSITRVDDGLIYNCYRCGISGKRFIGRTPSSAAKYLKERRKTHKSNMITEVHLPKDFTPMAYNYKTVPAKAYAYMYQFELDRNDMYRFNIGYSNSHNGIVIPIYNDNELIGYQSRNLDYTYNKEIRELKYYTESKVKQLYYYINNNNDYTKLFITEDMYSSIKVSKLKNNNCLALLGTKIHNNLFTLLKEYKTIYLWLDYNAKIQCLKQIKHLRSLGYDAKAIITEKDPKSVPFRIMRGIVK